MKKIESDQYKKPIFYLHSFQVAGRKLNIIYRFGAGLLLLVAIFSTKVLPFLYGVFTGCFITYAIYSFWVVIRCGIVITWRTNLKLLPLEIKNFYFLRENKIQHVRKLVHTKARIVYSELYITPNKHWLLFDPIRKLILNKKIKNALILGGGGGAIGFTLLKDGCAAAVDLVEYNRTIITIATKIFLPQPLPKSLHFIHDNASTFVARRGKKYDFVFIDLFEGSNLSNALSEPGFIPSFFKRLKKNGVLVINLGFIDSDISLIIRQLKIYFPDIGIFFSNHVVYAISPSTLAKNIHLMRVI